MRKLSESVWGDVRRRAEGQGIRKEDAIGNLAELKPVDMGGSVLWVNYNFQYQGKSLFTWDEANELIENISWRLPTREEVAELEHINRYYDEENIYIGDGKELTLKKDGMAYVFHGKDSVLDTNSVFYGWTSEPYEYSSNSIHVFVIDHFNFELSSPGSRINDQVTQSRDSKCSVILVRNK